MRVETVNAIMIYQAIGAIINTLAVWITLNLYISTTEQVLIIACVNMIYILVSKDVARKHEQVTCKRIDRMLYGKHRPQ